MSRYNKKYPTRKTLKVNKDNDISSIIEVFQYFGSKYNVIATDLDEGIQYETRNTKITQTYTTTLLDEDIDDITKKLKNKGRITIIIIDNTKKITNSKKNKINSTILDMNRLDKVTTRITKQKDTFKTLDDIIRGKANETPTEYLLH